MWQPASHAIVCDIFGLKLHRTAQKGEVTESLPSSLIKRLPA